MQYELFTDIENTAKFPTTRYQGSKLKYIDWIWFCIKDLQFNTVLDAFGGTGAVAFKLKKEGKEVVYNDILKFNPIIGKAIIENCNNIIEDYELETILKKQDNIDYPNFIEKTFYDIYFTEEENKWLDITSTNIANITNPYKQAIAWFALFQSCIIKRPYNLLHRKNLYIRTQDVKRTFGNKATWDTPFQTHFKDFIHQANNSIFDNNKNNKSINKDVSEIKTNFDLVYIDTPYISEKGVGLDYLDFYHFLEGIIDYNTWNQRIDYQSKHKRLKRNNSDWANARSIESAFERLFHQFKNSILVISYRSDGIPSIERIKELLVNYEKKVTIHESCEMKYALSLKQSKEVLIIAQ